MQAEQSHANNSDRRAHLVFFDMAVIARSPAGSCVLQEVRGLSATYDITVFSSQFDALGPGSQEWVRIPLPVRPLFLRYWVFQLLAPWHFARWRRRGGRADSVQTTQGQYVGSHVSYAHFCHRAYLQGPWRDSPVRGVRRMARWMNHSFNAFFERRAFMRATKVVVPSFGLARELASTYPEVADRIETLANPVDVERFSRPFDFDRAAFRQQLGFDSHDTVFAFMALGDFGRKGLGVIVDAVASLVPAQLRATRVMVIGGQASEIAEYLALAERAGVIGHFKFVGMQADVRSFLWAADVYAFPSLYEIFSLAILQAAAAGLPVIVSQGLYGAEEFIVDGVNGWQVHRSTSGVAEAMSRAIESPTRLPEMGKASAASVQKYSESAFVARWLALYAKLRLAKHSEHRRQ